MVSIPRFELFLAFLNKHFLAFQTDLVAINLLLSLKKKDNKIRTRHFLRHSCGFARYQVLRNSFVSLDGGLSAEY